jgi:integrase
LWHCCGDFESAESRHIYTSASLAVARGDNPKVVSERLGHTNVAFTLNTYVETFANQRKEAALGMADLFPRVEGTAPN